jgi:hypothetical protein
LARPFGRDKFGKAPDWHDRNSAANRSAPPMTSDWEVSLVDPCLPHALVHYRCAVRAVTFGLLTLGILLVAASASPGQTVTAPPTTATTASTTSTSTSTPIKPVTAGGGGTKLPTLGEGFPWITVGAVALVAGLVGARLRQVSRR